MFNVLYDEHNVFVSKIELFIESYKKGNLKRFDNTGIYYEDLIRENFINSAKRFKKDLFDDIHNVLEQDIVGCMVLGEKSFSIYISTGNFKIKLFYTEDISQKIREIYNIEFHKK